MSKVAFIVFYSGSWELESNFMEALFQDVTEFIEFVMKC